LQQEHLQAGNRRTHGEKRGSGPTPEYAAWIQAKNRCYNPKVKRFDRWGGRGIKMWQGWMNDFPAFLGHIGRRPSPAHSLDRFPDNDGDYAPGNVRWATRSAQARNQSRH